MGPDAWRVAELKALLVWILDRFAAVLNLIEETGEWPLALQEALGCLTPKDPKRHAPTDLRPLTITSMAYWLWGASRIGALLEWQGTWLPAGLRGFRRQAEAGDVWWTLAARIATCVQKGKALFGMSLTSGSAPIWRHTIYC